MKGDYVLTDRINLECNCKKKNCIRHGKCEECIEFHKTSKREPYCIRKSKKKLKV